MLLRQCLAALLLFSLAFAAEAQVHQYYAKCIQTPCNIQLTDPSNYDRTTVPMTAATQGEINTYQSLLAAMAQERAQPGDFLVLCNQFSCAYYQVQAGGKLNQTGKEKLDKGGDLSGGVDVLPVGQEPSGYVSGGPSSSGGCAITHVSQPSDPSDPESPPVTVSETVCWGS